MFNNTRSRPRTSLALIGGAGIVVAMFATCAAASASGATPAPPRNDNVATPRAITGVPITIHENTTHATSSGTDPRCVHPASVWYSYRPKKSQTLRVITLGTSYDSLVAIYRKSATDQNKIGCNDDRFSMNESGVQVHLSAGTRYLIAVSSYGRGGRTTVAFYNPRALTVHNFAITMLRARTVSGLLNARCRLSSTNPAELVMRVTARQRVGQNIAVASSNVRITDYNSRPFAWRTLLTKTNSWAFAPGRAAEVHVVVHLWDGWKYATWSHTSYPRVTGTYHLSRMRAAR